jgi:uncharacterized protein YggT (Ycf19 family)
MDDLGIRLALLVRLLVPFLFMMATVYLAAHILFARLISSPQSQALAFFAIVTAPLTRPIRAVLPAGTPDARVRVVALAVYFVLWIVTDRVARMFGPVVSG